MGMPSLKPKRGRSKGPLPKRLPFPSFPFPFPSKVSFLVLVKPAYILPSRCSQFGELSPASIGSCRRFSCSSHHCLTDRLTERRIQPHLEWWHTACCALVEVREGGGFAGRSRGATRVCQVPRVSSRNCSCETLWLYCAWSTYVRVAVHSANFCRRLRSCKFRRRLLSPVLRILCLCLCVFSPVGCCGCSKAG